MLILCYVWCCFVMCWVIDEGKVVGYFYCEVLEEENDSGWWLMVGDELDDYMNIVGIIVYVSLGLVLDVDDSILLLFDVLLGWVFEWLVDGFFIEVQGLEG